MVESTLIGNAHTSVRTLLKVIPSNGILVGLSATADNAKMIAPTATRKTTVRRLNMRLLRRKGARLTQFIRNRVVIFFVFIFYLGWIVNCNPGRCGTKNHSHQAL